MTRMERKRRRQWIAVYLILCAAILVLAGAIVWADPWEEKAVERVPYDPPYPMYADSTGYEMYAEPVIHDPVVSAILEPLGEFTLTAYCPCEDCCGKWALNRPDGIVYTASGEEAVVGVTVAVDPDIIPLGTELCIEGMGVYTAQDTGNFSGKVIDVYFDSHDAACAFGLVEGAKVWEVTQP